MSRYACVDDQKAAGFPVSMACEAAGVSTSGYYDWCARPGGGPTDRQVAEAELVELMRVVRRRRWQLRGAALYEALRRAGLVVNLKRVAGLMRVHGMAGRFRRRADRTTFPGPDGYVIADLVARHFAPGAPDVAWCQDITYIPTGRAGCFWRRRSIWVAAGWSATRWPTTCAPSSSSTHSRWLSPLGR